MSQGQPGYGKFVRLQQLGIDSEVANNLQQQESFGFLSALSAASQAPAAAPQTLSSGHLCASSGIQEISMTRLGVTWTGSPTIKEQRISGSGGRRERNC